MRYQHDDEKLEWDEIKESSCVNVGEQGCDKELLSICVSNCADRPMCVFYPTSRCCCFPRFATVSPFRQVQEKCA